jgi:hypothetical protein
MKGDEMSSGEGSHDFAFLSELAQLEDVLIVISEEFPETQGLMRTLLTDSEFERMAQGSKEREKARKERA